ncbi:MAG: HAD-IIIC family phosphatase [Bacteroidota bacterium]
MFPFLSSQALREEAFRIVDHDLLSLRCALLGERTTQFLAGQLPPAGKIKGLEIALYQGGYDQIQAEVLNPTSDLYQFQPEILVLLPSLGKRKRQFYALDSAEQQDFAQTYLAEQRQLIQTLRKQITGPIILGNLEIGLDEGFGHGANRQPASWLHQLRKINVGLMELAIEAESVHVLDIAALVSQVGLQQAQDPSLYVNADLPFTMDMEAYLAQALAQMMAAIRGKIKKCLVLDLDGTIWGGIIGDDGVAGIQVGGSGVGKAFLELQQWAKHLQQRGIILAICSKNEQRIAEAPFLSHPEMALKREDIAVFVANWSPKSENIRHIQEVLNLGLDSIVFLDDNPVERAEVRAALPQVAVPDLPKDPAKRLAYLRQCNFFEAASLSSSDSQRTQQHQAEAQRTASKPQFSDLKQFLQSLEMQAKVQPFQAAQLPRLAQLSQRTNQFNLRTLRYSEAELKLIMASPRHLTLQLELTDTFGPYGLIAMVIGEMQADGRLFLQHWCMSCRVFQRGVEQLTLNQLVSFARQMGATHLLGEIIATPKNGPVRELYQRLGFVQTEKEQWELALAEAMPLPHEIQLLNE